MSANFLKFRCTWTGRGRFICGQRALDYGEEIILPADQASKYVKHSDIAEGHMEFLGEANSADAAFSANIQNYLEGKMGNLAKDTLPMVVLPLKGAGTTTLQGDDVGAFVPLDREVALSRLLVRMPTTTTGVDAPAFLVTSGDMVKVTPTSLRYYDNSAGTYGSMTNGSIDAAAPITWAANDLMIVGYTEKFRSVNVSVDTAAATAGAINRVSYWNGKEWVAFDTFTDYTKEPAATNSFDRVAFALDTNIRVVWWEAPQDWVPGGPAGSKIPPNTYAVAMRVSGVLTTLDGARFYPVLDTPIADIDMGYAAQTTVVDAIVGKVGATYTDYTDATVILDLDATDYVYVGTSQPVGGHHWFITVANDQAVNTQIRYWAGNDWSGVATVATDDWAGTLTDSTDGGQDFDTTGPITWSSQPADWVKASYADLDSTAAAAFLALGTIVTDELYWIRYSASGAMKATTAAILNAVTYSPVAWFPFDPKNSYVHDGNLLHVHVIDEDATGSAELIAVLADI